MAPLPEGAIPFEFSAAGNRCHPRNGLFTLVQSDGINLGENLFLLVDNDARGLLFFFAESSNGARCVVRSVQVLLVVFFFSVSVDSWPMESTRPRELKARTNDKLQRSQMRKERAGAILLHATRFLYFSKYFLYRRSLTEFRRF